MERDSSCGTHAQKVLKTTKARLPASQLLHVEEVGKKVRCHGLDTYGVPKISLTRRGHHA